jgi:light-regulated signal transduction histidine kinase (bacteriophytochrome)
MNPPTDIEDCDSLVIDRPGSIQPHGVLLALAGAEAAIVAVSANAAQLLGVAPADLLGTRLADLTTNAACRALVPGHFAAFQVISSLEIVGGGQVSHWDALVPPSGGATGDQDGLLLLELEPPSRSGLNGGLLTSVSTTMRRLQAAVSVGEACQVAAEEIRQLTGLDRVKTYRFAADWSGEVLAEARNPAMPSYLGLRFPASDIPAPARRLYSTIPLRLIVDVDAPASVLMTTLPAVPLGDIDLSRAILRSVAPVHLDYLRNMQLRASMSISVMRDGVLWGLIACHHRTPLHLGFEVRQACHLIGQFLASQLDMLDKIARAGRRTNVVAIHARLSADIVLGHSAAEAMSHEGRRLLGVAAATGFAVVLPGGIIRVGELPGDGFLLALRDWLADRQTTVFATDRLAEHFAAAADHTATVSGLLAAALSRSQQSFLLWCRGEQAHTVTWAGEPTKRPAAGATRLQPRASFQAWTEEVRGRSVDWDLQDVAAAEQTREILLDLMMHEHDDLTRQNLRLVHSMQELETFLYVASHDINGPLRQMEMLISLLRTCLAPQRTIEATEYFAEFTELSKRLRQLTGGLSDFARFGRSDHDFWPVPLGALVAEVVENLRDQIAESGAEISIGPLPVVAGERLELHQVFLNLIGNALKYAKPDRAPKITVTVEPTDVPPTATSDGDAPQLVSLTVADNGIGFEPQFNERIFMPFERLHSRDDYQGTGLGLSICRRIVERHGGRIRARGDPGRGAAFTFSLQLRGM